MLSASSTARLCRSACPAFPAFVLRNGWASGNVINTDSGNRSSMCASPPSGTMVLPGRTCASSHAAVWDPAMATRTPSPRSQAMRRISSAITAGAPMTRVSPRASHTTTSSPCVSTRGEQARATDSSTPGLVALKESRTRQTNMGWTPFRWCVHCAPDAHVVRRRV